LTIRYYFRILYLSRGKENETTNRKELKMKISAIEFAKSHNIDIENAIYNDEEEKWLKDHELDVENLGEDGAIREIEEDYIPNWENFEDMVSKNHYYVIAFNHEYCENCYEFDSLEEAEKGMGYYINFIEGDSDLIEMASIYSGNELLVEIKHEIRYLNEEIEDYNSMQETYDSLRLPW